jgi:hypothetical protein
VSDAKRYAAFLREFQGVLVGVGPPAWALYRDPARRGWGPFLIKSLTEAGRRAWGEGLDFAARGLPDRGGREEYFGLDVCGNHTGSWHPPIVVMEHEPWPWGDRVKYAAWKLMSVDARYRVLVGCFGESKKTDEPVRTWDALVGMVIEVAGSGGARGDLLLLGTPVAANADVEDWGQLFRSTVVRASTTRA